MSSTPKKPQNLSLDFSLGQDDFINPIKTIHRGKNAYVGFGADNPDGWNLFSATIEELETNFPFLAKWLVKDAYFTVNSAYGPAPYNTKTTGLPGVLREERHLKYLNACYVDLDLGRPKSENPNARKTPNEAAAEIQDLMDLGKIPQCSLYARSGRGMYLFWLLRDEKDEDSPHYLAKGTLKEHLAFYKKVNQKLGERLESLAPDKGCYDGARVLRVPGTIHGKTGNQAVYWVPYDADGRPFTYKLSELAEFLGIDPTPISRESGERAFEWEEIDEAKREFDSVIDEGVQSFLEETNAASCPERLNGLIALHAKRARDLVLLEQSRGGWDKGDRKRLLTLYARFLRGTQMKKTTIVGEVKTMASRCNPPYPSDPNDTKILKIVTDVLTEAPYTFTTDFLVEYLSIQSDEVRRLGLQTLVTSEVAEERKAPFGGRRIVEKEKRLKVIVEHISQTQDFSARRLVEVLKAHGIEATKSTVDRDLRALAKQGNPTTQNRKKAGRPPRQPQLPL